jgi:hypothetical protein
MPSPDRHFANAAIFTHSTGITPNSGDAALYIKSDNKAYIKDSAGTEVIVGGTGTIAGTLGAVDNAVPRADGTGGVTAQGSDIVIDDATTSTANNVAITNQHAGQTNSSLVLSPKGTGALLANKPNGAASGGNARGSNAVDLQMVRGGAAQVASGAQSFLLAGTNNTATGNTCGILGGDNNLASGNTSCILAANDSQATATRAVAIGWRALADRRAMIAHASSGFATAGDSQHAFFNLRGKTTTNAAVELFIDTTNRITIPSGKVLALTINICGISSTGAAVAHYLRQYALKNVSGTTTEVYAPVTIGTDNAAGTSIALSASDAADALVVSVTGTASTIWRWVASVDAVEIAFGT